MRAVLQRVSRARVTVDEEVVGAIGPGVLVLLGVLQGDGEREARALAERIARFRMFRDDADRMNASVLDVGGEALVVSQFTLAFDGSRSGKRGRRPSFDAAAPAEAARVLYESFVEALRACGVPVRTGRFQARMRVELENDGPVTFVLDEAATSATAPDGAE